MSHATEVGATIGQAAAGVAVVAVRAQAREVVFLQVAGDAAAVVGLRAAGEATTLRHNRQ